MADHDSSRGSLDMDAALLAAAADDEQRLQDEVAVESDGAPSSPSKSESGSDYRVEENGDDQQSGGWNSFSLFILSVLFQTISFYLSDDNDDDDDEVAASSSSEEEAEVQPKKRPARSRKISDDMLQVCQFIDPSYHVNCWFTCSYWLSKIAYVGRADNAKRFND